MTDKELIKIAVNALKNSYAPYSNFNVAAVLLSKSGKVYTGVNVENSSFGATICAERTAISKAVSEGETKFLKIVIIGGKNGAINSFCTPCGICRQVFSEFCEKDFTIILFDGKNTKHLTLEEIIPHSFGRESLC